MPVHPLQNCKSIWHTWERVLEMFVARITGIRGYVDSIGCDICKIYRDWKTNIKFIPPRFAHEQDPDMVL